MAGGWDETFESTVRGVLAELPPEQELRPADSLRGLGLTSVGMVSLLMALERAYGVAFPEEALVPETCANPEVLWRAVSALREQAGQGAHGG